VLFAWQINHLVVSMRCAIVVVSVEVQFLYVCFQAVWAGPLRNGGDVTAAE
jgi:hypothetical protein